MIRTDTAQHSTSKGISMSTIAVIGLGVMGLPIARHFVTSGHDVVGVNRGDAPRLALEAAGGRSTTVVADAVATADVVITMLPDSPDVLGVALGDAGIFASVRPGTLFIDMSSVAPSTALQLAEAASAAGVRFLDAPVSGGEQAAIDAALSIMVGASEADFAAARPLLDVVGSTVVRVGGVSAGQTVKAANQLIVAGTIQLVAEALTLLDARGVDLEPAVTVLAGGLAGNRILDRKASGMIAHEFQPGFRAALHHKDLGIVLDAARESAVVTPLGSLVAQLMASLVANGDGGLDHTALLLGVERLSGVSR